MRKLRFRISIIMIAVIIYMFTGCGTLEVIGKTNLPELESRKELCDFIEEQLKAGEDEMRAYVSKDVTEEQFSNLNEYLDGYYGKVDKYSYKKSWKQGYYSVVLYGEISDNYYAENIIKKKIDKSDAPKTAVKLANKAKHILKKIIDDDMTDYEKELAIHDYIVANGKYGYLSNDDMDQSYCAYGILVKGKGVCQAYAEATQLLLNLCDIESEIIVGTGTQTGENHAWNLVKLGGKWYQLDATWDDPAPDKEGRVLYTYFNITDDEMEKDHAWDTTSYPKATATKYNYYTQRGIRFETQKEAIAYMKDAVASDHANQIDFMVEDYDEDVYGSEWASFLWRQGDIDSITYEMYGKGKHVAFRFYVTYA